MGILDLFKPGKKKEQMKEMLENGALIVDVRSRGEFQGGHVAGSQNIPLNELSASLSKLKAKNKPVIFCCASGMRSSSAASQAKSAGIDAMNGGGWMSVNGVVEG